MEEEMGDMFTDLTKPWVWATASFRLYISIDEQPNATKQYMPTPSLRTG
jgi:hypothetical protein